MAKSRTLETFWLLAGSLFCLLWGGYSILCCAFAVVRGEISLVFRLNQRPREGGPHSWAEDPGLFLFALLLLLGQGAVVFWMGIGLARSALRARGR